MEVQRRSFQLELERVKEELERVESISTAIGDRIFKDPKTGTGAAAHAAVNQ